MQGRRVSVNLSVGVMRSYFTIEASARRSTERFKSGMHYEALDESSHRRPLADTACTPPVQYCIMSAYASLYLIT